MEARAINTTMTETITPEHLIRLQAWMSPSFPTGSFAYSHGLERAVDDGLVMDQETFHHWLRTLLTEGSVKNDAILLAESWRCAQSGKSVKALNDLAVAMAVSGERLLEATAQGDAFLEAAHTWLPNTFQPLGETVALPVAVGAVCGATDIPLKAGLTAFLHAFANNQCQAAIRLSVLGQTGLAIILADIEPMILKEAERACHKTLDDLGSFTIAADIVAMRHETQHTRLFRS